MWLLTLLGFVCTELLTMALVSVDILRMGILPFLASLSLRVSVNGPLNIKEWLKYTYSSSLQ